MEIIDRIDNYGSHVRWSLCSNVDFKPNFDHDGSQIRKKRCSGELNDSYLCRFQITSIGYWSQKLYSFNGGFSAVLCWTINSHYHHEQHLSTQWRWHRRLLPHWWYSYLHSTGHYGGLPSTVCSKHRKLYIFSSILSYFIYE